MAETSQEMLRQIVAYSMAEMRNRGLEEAARIIDSRYVRTADARTRYDFQMAAASVRSLKTDPAACLSDWFDKQTVGEAVNEAG